MAGVVHQKARIAALYASSVLAGILVFLALCIPIMDLTVFSTEFSKYVVNGSGIYDRITDIAASYLSNAANTVNMSENQIMLDVIEIAADPESVKANVNSLQDGIYSYIRNKSSLLPDIKLAMPKKYGNDVPAFIPPGKSNPEPIAKIDHINLGAILMYFHQDSISQGLLAAKLAFHMLNRLPVVLLPLLAVLTAAGLFLCRRSEHLIYWAAKALSVAGFSLIATSIAISAACFIPFDKLMLPFLENRLAADPSFVLYAVAVYMRRTIILLSSALMVPGLPLAVSCSIVRKKHSVFTDYANDGHTGVIHRYAAGRILQAVLVVIIVFSGATSEIGQVEKICSEMDSGMYQPLAVWLSRSVESSGVIDASGYSVCRLKVRLVEKGSGKAISGIPVSIMERGIANPSSKGIEIQSSSPMVQTADKDGYAVFLLHKGTFLIRLAETEPAVPYKAACPVEVRLEPYGIDTVNLELEYAG